MRKTINVISRYGAGLDRIDLKAASDRGIIVTNTPGTNSIAVCELTFALMLSLARAIPKLSTAVKNGEWPRSTGLELYGKTLGIIGLGAIGKNVAVRAQAFGMKVIGYDPYLDVAYAKENKITAVRLNELLTKSDIVTLHVPLNENTKHMIGKNEIKKMKDKVLLINTARGGLIDETAALEAIQTGKIGGMGLDAFEVEPAISSPFAGFENVVMTPHTGAHTNEAITAMGIMAVQNLIDVLEGYDCPNIVKQV